MVYERAIKEKERGGKGYDCARNGQPGIYTNSTRGIRRRGGNDSAELYRATDQRNYRKSMEILFSPAVSPLGFARLSPPPLSLFLSGSSFTFHVFHPFFTSRSIPAIVCLRTCAHIVRRERMILTRRKGKERREKKTSWTDDDGCSVCFNSLF